MLNYFLSNSLETNSFEFSVPLNMKINDIKLNNSNAIVKKCYVYKNKGEMWLLRVIQIHRYNTKLLEEFNLTWRTDVLVCSGGYRVFKCHFHFAAVSLINQC